MVTENFDRATRKVVDQYFGQELNETHDLGEFSSLGYEPWLNQFAGEARDTFIELLNACNDAEANSSRGRTPIITVSRIRQLIVEGLAK